MGVRNEGGGGGGEEGVEKGERDLFVSVAWVGWMKGARLSPWLLE